LPFGQKPTEELKQLSEPATTKSRIYVDFKETEANTGFIIFSTLTFNIAWLGDEIFDVSTMEYSTCVKCLRRPLTAPIDTHKKGKTIILGD
jgi:hypothetical protein